MFNKDQRLIKKKKTTGTGIAEANEISFIQVNRNYNKVVLIT